MPPRLPAQLRSQGRQSILFRGNTLPNRQPTCFFCVFSLDRNQEAVARRLKTKTRAPTVQRYATTIVTPTIPTNANPNPNLNTDINPNPDIDPRQELEFILLGLQKHAANYVNLSRIHLALNGLRQKPGNESIRIAILGLTSGSRPSSTAKEVLRLLLADPLKDAEAWEQEVEHHDLAEPVIVRIGAEHRGTSTEPAISLRKGSLLREIHVSSPNLNGQNLEILLADTNPFLPASRHGALDSFEDTVLVPTVDIPTSNTGRYTPITTPVHKALIVADGIHGAASVMTMPTLENSSVLKYAVNIPEYKPNDKTILPFTHIDTSLANRGLGLVRKSVSNAMDYEQLWFQSNVHKLVEWLKTDIIATSENETKPPVRELIASILRNTSASIREEEARRQKTSASLTNTRALPRTIERGLSEWAESAHSELQEQLDLAFSSRRWRKLSWWKLFWRVDDVGMLTSDILAQRFLPEAERSSIFLSGRMREAGVTLVEPSQISPESKTLVTPSDQSHKAGPEVDLPTSSRKTINWPKNIPNARYYLQTETVPALQALAQKLVLQTVSTSGLTTALGALVYISTLSGTLYEAGAVAALGLVWSMRRMQKKWEAARQFWEGEVREEGRKAVRDVEETMASALTQSSARKQELDVVNRQDDLEKASDLVMRAEKLLEELK